MSSSSSIKVTDDPLSPVIPPEVHLRYAPLISVLAQLRFPAQPGFDHRDTVTPFLDALRPVYPVVREEAVRGIVFQPFQASDPSKVAEPKGWTIWRLFDVDGKWRISMARDFLSLDTSAYLSHDDFIDRLKLILGAFPETLRPPVIDRFGLRYVDRIVAPGFSRITELVRSELLGVLSTPASQRVVQSFSESVFDMTPHRLVARWGQLPPNASYDPGTVNPITEPSWILDLDMSQERTRAFSIDEVAADAQSYTRAIYTFFRWAVKPEFLTYFNTYEK
jgi:uncharacterized protein (TIGR04255 family)